MKLAKKWTDLSNQEQYRYLQRHRRSKLRPTSSPESEEMSEIRQSMGKLNSMVEGKEHAVKQQIDKWISKLEILGFEEIVNDENKRVFQKDDIEASIKFGKGPMRYYASFEIKKENFQHVAKIQSEFIKSLYTL